MAANQATGQEAGAVYVSVVPSGQGFSKSMDSQLTGAFDGAQSKGTASFGRFFAKVAAAGAAVLAGIGLKNLIKSTVSLGVSYNTLEQSSKAAFTTLLGTADAAAAMQKQIREFASTSPFPRQAFIEGTQQLLAFGYSAEQVIPTLQAVQDATAAAGGSSQDLQDIIFVMAQIRAAGKITGQDLIQFGQRGINAADLIGAQMGKTGAQIKAAITDGSLGADQALDALTKGMEAKFGGAAANLKGTWVGATDRIKGAWRDLSSALVAPFIDPNGGGYAVGWANKFADLLRTIEASAGFASLKAKLSDFGKTLDPIVNQAAELVGLLFKADGKSKFFAALANIPSLAPYVGALTALSGIADKLAPVAPALGDALVKVGQALLQEGVIDALTELIVKVLPPLADLLVAVAPLIPPIAQVLTFLLVPAVNALSDSIGGDVDVWKALFHLLSGDTSLTDFATKILAIPGPVGDAYRAQMSTMLGFFNFVRSLIMNGMNLGIDALNGMMEAFASALNGMAAVFHLPQYNVKRLPHLWIDEFIIPGIGGARTSGLNSTAAGLADSGTVLPRPGGTLILAAEAGRAESVVDTGKLNDLMDAAAGGGGSGGISVTLQNPDPYTLLSLFEQRFGQRLRFAK